MNYFLYFLLFETAKKFENSVNYDLIENCHAMREPAQRDKLKIRKLFHWLHAVWQVGLRKSWEGLSQLGGMLHCATDPQRLQFGPLKQYLAPGKL